MAQTDLVPGWYITDPANPVYAPFLGIFGVSSSMVFSAIGAAYGTARCMLGIAEISFTRPQFIMKSIVPVVMAGVVAIYGLVVAVVLAGKLQPAPKYSLYEGIVSLGAGVTMGLSGLAAGYCIGIVGDAGIRSSAYQPKGYTMLLGIVGFAMVIGIYGLIGAMILNSRI